MSNTLITFNKPWRVRGENCSQYLVQTHNVLETRKIVTIYKYSVPPELVNLAIESGGVKAKL